MKLEKDIMKLKDLLKVFKTLRLEYDFLRITCGYRTENYTKNQITMHPSYIKEFLNSEIISAEIGINEIKLLLD